MLAGKVKKNSIFKKKQKKKQKKKKKQLIFPLPGALNNPKITSNSKILWRKNYCHSAIFIILS